MMIIHIYFRLGSGTLLTLTPCHHQCKAQKAEWERSQRKKSNTKLQETSDGSGMGRASSGMTGRDGMNTGHIIWHHVSRHRVLEVKLGTAASPLLYRKI